MIKNENGGTKIAILIAYDEENDRIIPDEELDIHNNDWTHYGG